MSITIAQICDAIKETLAANPLLEVAQSYNQLTEGMNDTPALQVYWDGVTQDTTTSTDRTTFQGYVRQSEVIIFCDYYARQRSQIAEDMEALIDGIDAMALIFEQQDKKPYFGLEGLKAFHWTAQRVIFQYGDPAIPFVGARFTVTVRVF